MVSASVNGYTARQLAQPVLYEVPLASLATQCIFWDFAQAAWSAEGCTLALSSDLRPQCQCSHLTDFSLSSGLIDDDDRNAAAGIGALNTDDAEIGCLIGAIILLVVILEYSLCSRRTERDVPGHVFVCLAFGIFLSHLAIVFGARRESLFGYSMSENACKATGVIIHVFFMAAFFWVMLSAADMYHSLAFFWDRRSSKRTIYYYLAGYGIPAAFGIIVVGVDPGVYVSEQACWVQGVTNFLALFAETGVRATFATRWTCPLWVPPLDAKRQEILEILGRTVFPCTRASSASVRSGAVKNSTRSMMRSAAPRVISSMSSSLSF